MDISDARSGPLRSISWLVVDACIAVGLAVLAVAGPLFGPRSAFGEVAPGTILLLSSDGSISARPGNVASNLPETQPRLHGFTRCDPVLRDITQGQLEGEIRWRMKDHR